MLKFKILEYRDPYAPLPEHFGGERYAEGLVVEFYPDNGEKWVGNFLKSSNGSTDIIEHPDGRSIIVVASGAGYVIDPEKHSLVSVIGHLIGNIIPIPEFKEIIFEDLGLWLIAIGVEGVRWHTRRISWDGIRSLSRLGRTLYGEVRDPYDESWHPFTVDLTNGDTEGGSYWEKAIP